MLFPAQNSDLNQAPRIRCTEGRYSIFVTSPTQHRQAQDGWPLREAGSAICFSAGLVWKQEGVARPAGTKASVVVI